MELNYRKEYLLLDFELSEEQRLMQKAVRELAEKSIAPRAAEYDRSGSFPLENIKELSRLNVLGMVTSTKFGGTGAGFLSHAVVLEELSKACANTSFICAVHTCLAATTLELFGTEEQKNRYLTPLAKGEKLGAFALTEPSAGSDVSSLQTNALLEGDQYVLNGSKCFITNTGQAETYVIFASDKGKGGTSAFIVEKGTPGFNFGKIEDKVGLRASANGELILRDCRIPKDNLLGSAGEGIKVALSSLDRGRIGAAAMGVGIGAAALAIAKSYARERVQFGQPIASLEGIQFKVADMATEIDAARLLTYRAAQLADRGVRFTREASMAKLYASEAAMRATLEAVQIMGGYGLSREQAVERHMRDAKALALIEGTSEIQRIVVSRFELK
jgi:alkylation response protein AidB-like acyl-CoA dehydrogenase